MLILNTNFFLWVIISIKIAIFVRVNCKIESFYDPRENSGSIMCTMCIFGWIVSSERKEI